MKSNALVMRIKTELDPGGVFGLPLQEAKRAIEELAGNFG